MTQSFKLNGRSIILGFSSLALTLFAGYLGLNAAGVIGGPPKLTEAELKAGLQEYADTINVEGGLYFDCLLYTSPSPRDRQKYRMPSSA